MPDGPGRLTAQLQVRDLVVRYGSVTAVDGVSFAAREGEFVSLLGPSGCGKTTTLRCIAGLETAASGEIGIGGTLVAAPGREIPAERRGVNMVFQSYAVWPHMTVFDNVAYGLRTRRLDRDSIARRTQEALRLVGLAGYAERYGTELSGGQQQRVAVARAVVTEPALLLFDEPLSNLDAGLRERMRVDLVALQRRLGRTSLYVTHDQAEAMAMSDRVILMDRGRIVQQGSPRELYERPCCRFAAEFLGSANLLSATAEATPGGSIVHIAGGPTLRSTATLPGRASGAVLVCIRPEDVVPAAGPGENILAVRVLRASYLGARLDCDVQAGDITLRASLPARSGLTEGAELEVRIDPDSVVLVPEETKP